MRQRKLKKVEYGPGWKRRAGWGVLAMVLGAAAGGGAGLANGTLTIGPLGAKSTAPGSSERPSVTSSAPVAPTTGQPVASRQQKVETALKGLGNDKVKAVGVRALDGTVAAALNGDEPLTTASVFKLPVAYSVLKRIDDGSKSFSSPVNGTTYKDCLNKMIIDSDNDCANRFIDGITHTAITAEARALGMNNTTIVPGDVNPERRSTANDVTLFLAKLASGSLLKPDSNALLTNLMKQQKRDRSGIPDALAPISVADKPGFGTNGMNNDAGLVYAPSGTYAVAIFTQNVGNMSVVNSVAKAVNAAMTG